jgi:WhiB family redox-sensing transcriptional regulator
VDVVTRRDPGEAQPYSARFEPRSQRWDWYLRARCRGQPSDIFFAPDNETRAQRRRREEHAKQMCRSCAVLERCRSYAISAGEPHGIWGATTPLERRALVHRRADRYA